MAKRKAKVQPTRTTLRKSTAGANSKANLSRNDVLNLGRQVGQSGWRVINYGGDIAKNTVYEIDMPKRVQRRVRRLMVKVIKYGDPKDVQRVLDNFKKYTDVVSEVIPPVQKVPGYDARGVSKKVSKKRSTWGAKKRKRKGMIQPVDTNKAASTEHSQSTVVQTPSGESLQNRNGSNGDGKATGFSVNFQIEFTCEHTQKVKRYLPITSAGDGQYRIPLMSKRKHEVTLRCLETATNSKGRKGRKQHLCSRHGKVRQHSLREQDDLRRNKLLWV